MLWLSALKLWTTAACQVLILKKNRSIHTFSHKKPTYIKLEQESKKTVVECGHILRKQIRALPRAIRSAISLFIRAQNDILCWSSSGQYSPDGPKLLAATKQWSCGTHRPPRSLAREWDIDLMLTSTVVKMFRVCFVFRIHIRIVLFGHCLLENHDSFEETYKVFEGML